MLTPVVPWPPPTSGPRRWTRILLRLVPALGLAALFTITGWRGIDFGEHWDEVEWHLRPAQEMVRSGVLLPRGYIYPSLSKWLVLLPSVPTGVKAAVHNLDDPRGMQAAMSAALGAPEYLLTVRRLFVLISALAILWVYGATLVMRRPWWEAFVAAAAFGLSWEYAYHARWVANDCLVVQFSALTLLTLALAHRTANPSWLYAAAAAVGLATGAKFPGVVLLVAVLAASASARPLGKVRAHLFRMAALCATAFAAYLLTTPGTLLDVFKFLEDGRRIRSVYESGHYGYSVASAFEHWRLVLTYFAVDYFSVCRGLSIALFGMVLLGGVVWVRAERRFGVILVGVPLLFLLFFARYNVLIVRNYLLLAPFLGVLAARGFAEIMPRIPARWGRWSLAGAVSLAFAAQGAWLIGAAESIRHPDPRADVQQAIAYAADHPKVRFRLSARVRALAGEQKLALSPNTAAGQDADVLLFFARAEGPSPRRWRTNDPWLTEAVFGPREVNFNWYSTWGGRDRIVAMTAEKAAASGVSLAP